MKRKIDIVDAAVAALLYGVSTWGFVQFLAGMGGTEAAYVAANVARAIAFEASRAVLWVRGIAKRNVAFMGMAIFLTGIVLFGNVGNMLAGIEGTAAKGDSTNYAIEQAKKRVALLDESLAVERKRLAEIPPDYVTAADKIRAEISDLLQARDSAVEEAERAERDGAAGAEAEARASVFAAVGKAIKADEAGVEKIRIGFLLLLILGTDVGSLLMSWAAMREEEDEVNEVQSGSGERERVIEVRADSGPQDLEEVLDPGEDPVPPEPFGKIGQLCFYEDGRTRSQLFASRSRAMEAGITGEEYAEAIRRGLMAGVLRKSKGRIYFAKGVRRDEFLKEVRSWPN